MKSIDSIEKARALKAKLLYDPLFFTRFFFKHQYNRKFIVGDHHVQICKKIKKVLNGETTRLIINMPPRYGKTELVVKSFMALGFALNPKCKFIHTSYSDVLALDNSESVRDLIKSDIYQTLFPIKTKKDSDAKSKWYTESGGGVYATASGGQITGFGAGQVDEDDQDLKEWINELEKMQDFSGAIIIDDPVKPEDARSETKRELVNTRFDSTIRSRTNSRNTPIIVIMQRVHDMDLTGYLKAIEPNIWDVLSLPAIKENGTALWEFKHNIEELYHLRKVNFYVFNTQYQQKTENIKTGGEFLESFEVQEHVKNVEIEENTILHISIDSNVLPYIAVSVWQIIKNDYNYIVRQVNELPARDPINTARKAGRNCAEWLKTIGYNDTIYMYGDPTTKNSNNIDDDKKTFYDLFTESLRKEGYSISDYLSRSNTSVSAMGDFVNAVLDNCIENITIEIGENCTESIGDYIETKKDKDGSILKKRETDPVTKISYEKHGHFTDTFKDFICQAFRSEFHEHKKGIIDIKPILGFKRKII